MLTPVLLDAHNPGPMTGRGNNTYLVVGPDGDAVLIDAGVGDPRHLADLAAELDSRSARLTRLLVTHGHADHASGAPAIAAAHPGVRVQKFPWRGVDEAAGVGWEALADGDEVRLGDDMLRSSIHPAIHQIIWCSGIRQHGPHLRATSSSAAAAS